MTLVAWSRWIGGGTFGRVGQDRVLLADDRIGQVLFARGGIGADGEHRRERYA